MSFYINIYQSNYSITSLYKLARAQARAHYIGGSLINFLIQLDLFPYKTFQVLAQVYVVEAALESTLKFFCQAHCSFPTFFLKREKKSLSFWYIFPIFFRLMQKSFVLLFSIYGEMLLSKKLCFGHKYKIKMQSFIESCFLFINVSHIIRLKILKRYTFCKFFVSWGYFWRWYVKTQWKVVSDFTGKNGHFPPCDRFFF